jgi:molybdopterin biosynthesis enzyme MoaB
LDQLSEDQDVGDSASGSAGLAEGPYIFAVPGSTGAYKDARHEMSVCQQDDRHVSASFRMGAAADGMSEMNHRIHGFL